MPDPQREGHVEQEQERPQSEVDARAGKPREENGERDPGSSEATTGGDVASSSVGQVAQDRVRGDLGAEHLEDGREGEEVLAESNDGANDSSLCELLEEKRQEGCRRKRSQ